MDNVRVPIIVGVTGHRDIPAEDEAAISDAVRQHLKKIKEKYPDTPFKLISGLAEGADRLVAVVALELEFSLLAALPMDQDEYEQDFQNPNSLTHFRSLIDRADNCFVVESTPEQSRNGKYLALGHYIARHSQIVIALWDGVSEQRMPDGTTQILMGGTADVVRLCQSGLLSMDSERIELPETTRVDHFYVRRDRATDQTEHGAVRIGELTVLSDKEKCNQVEAMLENIDRFNEHALELPTEKLNQSRDWLIGNNAPSIVMERLAAPIAVFSAADAAAGVRQTEKLWAIKWISKLALASIVCQQVYSGPDMRWGWLAGHVGLAILAFFAFRHFFKGSHPREEQYLDWRALAEGLRVQIFWLASGIRGSVAEHYLSIDRGELDWIRQAIRNSFIGLRPIESEEMLKWVRAAWLEDQGNFFTKKAPINAASSKYYATLTNRFFSAALIITFSTLLAHLAGASDLILNGLVLASGISFVLSAVLKTYADQMAFDEQHNRYKGMSQIFKMALDRYDCAMNSGSYAGARRMLFNVGKEALTENAGWLRMHRQRQFEVSVA